MSSPMVSALLAELDDDALGELAARLAPHLTPVGTGDAWVTADVVAEHLGLSRVRIYELARDGLPHRRVGQRAMRFQIAAVDSYLNTNPKENR